MQIRVLTNDLLVDIYQSLYSVMEKAIFALEFEQIKTAYKKMKDDG